MRGEGAPGVKARTTRTVVLAVLGICFMTGLAFASVPLYRLFCEATGLNGTTNRALAAPGSTVQLSQRGKVHSATVTPMPFVPHRYHRGVK